MILFQQCASQVICFQSYNSSQGSRYTCAWCIHVRSMCIVAIVVSCIIACTCSLTSHPVPIAKQKRDWLIRLSCMYIHVCAKTQTTIHSPDKSTYNYLWGFYPLPTPPYPECVYQLWPTYLRYCWKRNRKAMPHVRGNLAMLGKSIVWGLCSWSNPSWGALSHWQTNVHTPPFVLLCTFMSMLW